MLKGKKNKPKISRYCANKKKKSVNAVKDAVTQLGAEC